MHKECIAFESPGGSIDLKLTDLLARGTYFVVLNKVHGGVYPEDEVLGYLKLENDVLQVSADFGAGSGVSVSFDGESVHISTLEEQISLEVEPWAPHSRAWETLGDIEKAPVAEEQESFWWRLVGVFI